MTVGPGTAAGNPLETGDPLETYFRVSVGDGYGGMSASGVARLANDELAGGISVSHKGYDGVELLFVESVSPLRSDTFGTLYAGWQIYGYGQGWVQEWGGSGLLYRANVSSDGFFQVGAYPFADSRTAYFWTDRGAWRPVTEYASLNLDSGTPTDVLDRSGGGGLNVDLSDSGAGGTVAASFTIIAASSAAETIPDYDFTSLLLPNETLQLWEIDFDGVVSAAAPAKLTFEYDPTGLSPEEVNRLTILHLEGGEWTDLNGTLNGDGTLSVYTDSFSPFVLSTTPVPIPPAVLLFGSALFGLARLARRENG